MENKRFLNIVMGNREDKILLAKEHGGLSALKCRVKWAASRAAEKSAFDQDY